MSAPMSRAKTTAETMIDLQFAALASEDPVRKAAYAAFAERGLPGRRDEAWHYTDLRAAMQQAYTPAPAPDASRIAAAREALCTRAEWSAARFVLVDGYYVPELSDAPPAGLRSGLLGSWLAPLLGWPVGQIADPTVQLNGAFAPSGRGLLILAEEGARIERPIEIVHFATDPAAVYSYVHVTVGDGAAATVLESFFGAGAGHQRNARTFLTVGKGARLDFVTQVTDAAAVHVETQEVLLAEAAEYRGFGLVTGGALVRRQLFALQQKPDARIALSGLSLIDGKRHADTTLTVRHSAAHGESREFYRHIVADEGVGVYQGKVIVDQHSQKTDGGMKSQALLLSPTAQMNNKPELEIFADDVVCGHGATVGALDPNQIFYLEARGIPKREAEAMLLEAFGVEAIERVENEAIAEVLREKLSEWLKGRAA